MLGQTVKAASFARSFLCLRRRSDRLGLDCVELSLRDGALSSGCLAFSISLAGLPAPAVLRAC